MPKIQDIKVFTGASMNLDVDEKVLKNNMFREIYNMIFDKYAAHYYPGNTLRNNTNLGASATFMGGCRDIKRNAYVIHIRQTYNNDMILWYFPETKTFRKILESSILNYQTGYPVQSVVVGDLLYWTDGWEFGADSTKFQQSYRNPPRKINMVKSANYIDKPYYNATVQNWDDGVLYSLNDYVLYLGRVYIALQAHTSTGLNEPTGTSGSNSYWQHIEKYDYRTSYLQPITERVIDRIKYPPIYAPRILNDETEDGIYFINGYGTDETFVVNFLRRKSFQFSYRYIYDDNEVSVFSPISIVPHPIGDQYTDGSFSLNTLTNNTIAIEIDLGPEEVIKVEIAVKESENGSWKIIERIYKYDENGSLKIPSTSSYRYLFYNNITAEGLDQGEINRVYDYVPQLSKNIDLIEDNRVLDADITEGYDHVKLDVDLSIKHEQKIFSGIQNEFVIQPNENPDGLSGFWHIITLPESVVEGNLYSLYFHYYQNGMSDPPDGYWYSDGEYYIAEVVQIASAGMDVIDVVEALSEKVRNRLGNTTDGEWVVYTHDNYPGLSINQLMLRNFKVINNEARWVIYIFGHESSIPDAYTTFKAGCFVNLGLVYHDRAGRSSSVESSGDLNVYIPFQVQSWVNNSGIYDPISIHRSLIDWKINHKPPYFADTYQWVLSRPNIEWFSQFIFKGTAIEELVAERRILINVNAPIKDILDVNPLSTLQYYSWEKGDRIRFLSKYYTGGDFVYFSQYYDFEILGVSYPNGDDAYLIDYDQSEGDNWSFVLDKEGNKTYDPAKMKIIIQYFNANESSSGIQGILALDEYQFCVVEIYRQRKPLADDESVWFMEISEKFPIINPHTSQRVHGKGNKGTLTTVYDQTNSTPATGQLEKGNAFVRLRNAVFTTFPCEDFSYSDFYRSNMPNYGRVFVIDRNMRRQRLISGMRYSGKYFENTLINNLSRVEWDAIDILPEKFGNITMVKQIGYTLRVKQFQKMTSIYIGREGLMQASAEGNEIVATSKNVLGAKITSENNYGLMTPQAYCTNGRDEYFVDILNGVIVRNATNGPFPISDYGIKEWVKDECDFLLNTCSQYRIFAAYDGYHDYVLFTFAGLSGKDWSVHTVIFSEPENLWKCFIDIDVNGDPFDGFLHDGMDLFGFYNGQLYTFNDGNVLEFFGTKRVPSVKLVANAEPFLVKLFKSISVYSDKVWYAKEYGDIEVPVSINHTLGMRSKLPAEHFESVEGVHRSAFLANSRSTKAVDNSYDLVNGQELRGEILTIKLTCDTNTQDVKLTGVTINALHSKRSGE